MGSSLRWNQNMAWHTRCKIVITIAGEIVRSVLPTRPLTRRMYQYVTCNSSSHCFLGIRRAEGSPRSQVRDKGFGGYGFSVGGCFGGYLAV